MIAPDRRQVVAGIAAALLTPGTSHGAAATDGAGRSVPVPDKVARVFPAGPPAAIFTYTLAPELLIGWPRANRPAEREFLLPDIGARPEVGRITGRGNTANLEVVLTLKPDLILDVGSVSATHVSLAERVQQQTGIPYALLDGRFASTAASYRTLGALIGQREQAETLARGRPHDRSRHRPDRGYPGKLASARLREARAARAGSKPAKGSINVETIELLADNAAGGTRGGLATVSIEQVLLWNPDVVITIDLDFAAGVRSDPAGRRSRRCARGACTSPLSCRSAGSIFRPASTG